MPNRALKPCREPGCSALIRSGSYCERHARPTQGGDNRHYNTARWKKLRAKFLAVHPFCFHHPLIRASHVDHIVPLKAGGTDDWENLQSLCQSCHSKKTAQVDGGFGNRVGR